MALALTGCPGPTAPRGQGISNEGGVPTDVLVFTVQPSAARAGEIITPAIQVTAHDTLGNTDTGFAGTVTIAIGGNPSGGFLGGRSGVAALRGVASFGDLRIDRAGTGYTLVARAFGARSATSAGFTITAP